MVSTHNKEINSILKEIDAEFNIRADNNTKETNKYRKTIFEVNKVQFYLAEFLLNQLVRMSYQTRIDRFLEILSLLQSGRLPYILLAKNDFADSVHLYLHEIRKNAPRAIVVGKWNEWIEHILLHRIKNGILVSIPVPISYVEYGYKLYNVNIFPIPVKTHPYSPIGYTKLDIEPHLDLGINQHYKHTC